MPDERDPTAPLVPDEDDDETPLAEDTAPEDVEFWPPLGESPGLRAPGETHAAAEHDTVPDDDVPDDDVPDDAADDGPTVVAAAGAPDAPEEPTVTMKPEATQRLPSVPAARGPLPSIEELTFAPRPAGPQESGAAADIVADEDVRPFVPRTLSRRRARILAAFADAIVPRGGALPEGAADAGVAERIDAALASFDPQVRKTVSRFLALAEWSTVFSRALRPFSRLDAGARGRAVERMATSRLLPRRAALDLLKFLCANAYAASPRFEQRIGFTYGCRTSDPPRDGEPLEVVGYPQIDRDHVEECDVVVVGSGAGGAVVAKEMAELGMSVIVIEEGASYSRKDFTGPPIDRMMRFYRKQGMTVALGRPIIPLPMGMAVGGSTLVNSGTCFRTPDRILQRWEREFELPQADPGAMRPFFDRVERIQRVQPVPEELLGNNAKVFRRGAERLGLHGAPLLRNIDGCRGCGVCAFGCPSDAKLSTHLTYLPRAQRGGASIYANTRAERVVVEGGRARSVECALLDPVTREPRARLRVDAKLVVLAAGAIHTPGILAASALGDHSGQLGRNLRIHPAAGVGALFDEEIKGWEGTLQSFYVDDWHESHDIMIEVTSSVPSVGAGTFPATGAALKELLASYPHLATAGLFVSDTSAGRVIPRRAREPVVTYRLNSADTIRLVRGMTRAAEVFLAAGARSVLTGLPGIEPVRSTAELAAVKEEAVKPGALRLTAFHPVGTCRMSADPAISVVDPWGAVHGVEGLFVSDASMLPGCPTVNPQITIMAFATRTADHIARHAGRYLA